MDDDSDRQAGAHHLGEIEITQVMIERGVVALNRLVGDDGSRFYDDEEIIRQILTSSLRGALSRDSKLA
jgi:hypothetical protein